MLLLLPLLTASLVAALPAALPFLTLMHPILEGCLGLGTNGSGMADELIRLGLGGVLVRVRRPLLLFPLSKLPPTLPAQRA